MFPGFNEEEIYPKPLPPNALQLKQKSEQLLISVLAFKIVDRSSMEEAGRLSKALSELDGDIHNSFDPIIESAHSLHKTSIAQRNIHLEPIHRGISHLKLQGRDFMLAEQRREREEKESQDRERQESERKQREAQAKIELEQRQAEESRIQAQREADRLLELAAKMESQGHKDESDKLLSQAVEATPAPVSFDYRNPIQPLPVLRLAPPEVWKPAIKSVPGLGSRKVWKWRTVNKALIPREYLIENQIVLNALAKTAKSHPEVIPGIEFYEDLEMRRS